MENSVDALKIAGAMLIFVLALSITISVFSNASQTLNRIFTASDNEKYITVTDAEGNETYFNFIRFNGGTREVTIDTIVPMIYRAYKENFAIYFYNQDGTEFELYKNAGESVNYIDLEKEVSHADSQAAVNWIKELLDDKGLYNTLKGYTFIERLGEYYQDDIGTGGSTEVAEANKTKKRVIVYQINGTI